MSTYTNFSSNNNNNGDENNDDDNKNYCTCLFFRCGLCLQSFATIRALLAHLCWGPDFALFFMFYFLFHFRDNFVIVDDNNVNYDGSDDIDVDDDANSADVNIPDAAEDNGQPGLVTLDLLREWTPIYASAPRAAPAPEPMEEDDNPNGVDLELRLWFN